jgi:hypothetical protein|tara:strand:- start:641 stop:1237 length:597 start_codon:yes stop_codon:yes gene_type:complete
MAREICIEFNGKSSKFGFSKISREKVYGSKKTVVVDGNNDPCVRGSIPIDGDVIIPKAGTSTLYINDHFEMFPRRDLEMYDSSGEKMELFPGTLNVEQKAKIVEQQKLLDHFITSIYFLEPSEIDDSIKKELDEGSILETVFNYYAGYSKSCLFIMKTAEGIFGLVGEPTNFEYSSHDAGEFVVEEEAEFDDMDFGML